MGKNKIIWSLICLIRGTSALTYYYMDYHCGDTISVGFSHPIRLKLTSSYRYHSDFRCQVTLKADLGDQLMVYFKNLNIESNCNNDWVELDDGQSRSASYIGRGKYCGYTTPSGVYTTSGRYMTIYFQSDSSVQGKGFDLVITPFHTGYCYSWEYSCNNARCIDGSLTCNGYNPCGDYSDCELSAGGIAGIVIGVLVSFTIIVIIVVVCRRRRVIVHQTTAMPTVATVQTTSVAAGYGYNQPVPQSYSAPPPPYPGTTVTTQYPQYPVSTGATAVQY